MTNLTLERSRPMPTADPGVRPVTLVGRDRELALLERSRERARTEPTTVVVLGATGLGKSALLARFLADHGPRRAFLLGVDDDEQDMPLSLVTTILRRIGAGADPAEVVVRDRSVTAIAMDLLEALAGLAGSGPLILAIDDVDRADPQSLQVLRFVVRRLAAEPILFVLSGTREWWTGSTTTTLTAQPGAYVVCRLRALGWDEIEQLARVELGGNLDREPAFIDTLREWSAGNPMVLNALLAQPDVRSGRVRRTDSGAELPVDISPVLDRLPAPMTALCAALAVLGEADAVALEVLSGRGEVQELLQSLIQVGLVCADDQRRPVDGRSLYRFANSAVRSAVETGLPDAERRRLHTGAAPLTAYPARWRHLVAAAEGPDEELACRLDQTCWAEVERGSLAQAATYAGWAAEVSGDPERRAERVYRAVRLLVRGGRDRAALGFAAAVTGSPTSWRRSEALGLLALAGGRLAQAHDLLAGARRIAPASVDPGELARLAIEDGTTCALLGLPGATTDAAAAAERLSQHPEIVPMAVALGAYGAALQSGPQAGIERLAGLPAEPGEIGSGWLPALTFRGILRGLAGQLRPAIADLKAVGRATWSEPSHVLGIAPSIYLVWCLYLDGQWDAARRELELASDLLVDHGRRVDRASLASVAAIMSAGMGDPDGARRHLAESRRVSADIEHLGPEFHQSLAVAAIAQADGDYGIVVQRLEPMLAPVADRARIDLFAPWWLPVLADAHLALRDFGPAAAVIRRLQTQAELGPLGRVVLAMLRVRLLTGIGKLDEAKVIAERVLAEPDFRSQSTHYAARLRQAYASCLAADGERARARDQYRIALKCFAGIGAANLYEACQRKMDDALGASTVDAVPVGPLLKLSPREREIAMLIGEGRTSPEIATRLYLSPRTVEYHLSKTFNKLDLRSRRELRDLVRAAS